ncbi:MAG TPA: chemotaxis protein CheW [Streptosporangiaceae bacterium]
MSIHVRLRVAGEAYAVPVQSVLEVVCPGPVTPVPGSAAELLGVLNLRGHVLAVADLARILGLRAAVPPARMLIAESGDLRAGFAIDDVSEVGELGEPTEPAESQLLAGATLAGGDLIGIIDLDLVLRRLAGARP